MQFISKVLALFSNVPLFLLFLIVHEVFFAVESPVIRIDIRENLFDEVWKKMKIFGRVLLFWSLAAALLMDVFTRDHLFMISILRAILQVYVVKELPADLTALGLIKPFRQFTTFRILQDYLLFLWDRIEPHEQESTYNLSTDPRLYRPFRCPMPNQQDFQ
jgi:hypothetical protein